MKKTKEGALQGLEIHNHLNGGATEEGKKSSDSTAKASSDTRRRVIPQIRARLGSKKGFTVKKGLWGQ